MDHLEILDTVFWMVFGGPNPCTGSWKIKSCCSNSSSCGTSKVDQHCNLHRIFIQVLTAPDDNMRNSELPHLINKPGPGENLLSLKGVSRTVFTFPCAILHGTGIKSRTKTQLCHFSPLGMYFKQTQSLTVIKERVKMSGWQHHLSLRVLTQIHFLGICNLLPKPPLAHFPTVSSYYFIKICFLTEWEAMPTHKHDVFLVKITSVYILVMISFVLSWGRKKRRISSWILISCLSPLFFI